MSKDQRSVSTDALATLGTILRPGEKRDAIHLAVEPVRAGQDLRPGDHLVVQGGVAHWAEPGSGLGIVDPFLTRPVREGDLFWFVLYPRQVTSLRHVWAHPAFPDEAGTPAPVVLPASGDQDPADQATPPPVQQATPPGATAVQLAVSKEWLLQYAARVNPYCIDGTYGNSPEEAVQDLLDGIRRGELVYKGTEMHDLGELIDADKLKYHAEIVLGRPVNWESFEYFSCSC